MTLLLYVYVQQTYLDENTHNDIKFVAHYQIYSFTLETACISDENFHKNIEQNIDINIDNCNEVTIM